MTHLTFPLGHGVTITFPIALQNAIIDGTFGPQISDLRSQIDKIASPDEVVEAAPPPGRKKETRPPA